MGNSNSGVMPGVVPEEVTCEHMKVVIVGPPLAGKSCIFQRYISMRFTEQYQPDLTANIGKSVVLVLQKENPMGISEVYGAGIEERKLVVGGSI